MVKPYYQDEWVTIYHGDCREILPELPKVDLVLTDPPYNVGKDYGLYKDNLPEPEYLEFIGAVIKEGGRLSNNNLAVYIGSEQIKKIWGLLPLAKLIVVEKRAMGVTKGKFALQYHGLLTTATPSNMVRDLWSDIRLPGEGYFFKEERFPTPGLTSATLFMRVISKFTETGQIVLDPFLGSGTTAYCAKKLNRKCIGIEIEEKYCEIAAKRCSQSVMELNI